MQNNALGYKEKFQFQNRSDRFRFLLGFLPGGDGVAHRTGMLAIERVRDGFGDGLRAEVAR